MFGALLRCVQSCFRPLVQHIILPHDSEATLLRKTITIYGSVVIGIFSATMAARYWLYDAKLPGFIMSLTAVHAFLSLLYFLLFKRVSDRAMELVLYGYLLLVVLLDYNNMRQMISRAWPLGVLILDVILACGLDDRCAYVCILALSVWFIVAFVEDVTRFGLLDVCASDEEYEWRMHLVLCDKPPCKLSLGGGLGLLIVSVLVFYLDFYITRSFARAVLTEKAKVETSIGIANRVAAALAEFDLEQASEVLQRSTENLPPGLREAFVQLLQNLRSYRPFLPDTLFDDVRSVASVETTISPPGTCGTATLVFADVEQAQALWNTAPDIFRRALKLFHKVLRDKVQKYDGYEVRTSGDSFMIAFESPLSAIRFAMQLQEALFVAVWPIQLLELPECYPEEGHAGLRIRVGMHFGEVEIELNSITNRFEYFGPAADCAEQARKAAVGGTVVITREMYEIVTMDSSIDNSMVALPHHLLLHYPGMYFIILRTEETGNFLL
ncbi:hypothetical protein DIPPA_50574 [Diplonema papillatum]|nr:hypothetical protein DIPPA_50574 [Diplonema papillatum]